MSASGQGAGDVAVREIARFNVKPGTESEFVAAYRSVRSVIGGSPGCRSVRMTRGVESPSSFVLLVEWDNLAAHMDTFRASEGFVAWRAAIGPFFAEPPTLEHVVDIDADIDADGAGAGAGAGIVGSTGIV
jgi:heme-degrading monooxygenase HmoA